MTLPHRLDPSVEPLDHVVGLRRLRRSQAVLDPQIGTELVDLVRASRLALAQAEEAVGDVLAIVHACNVDAARAGALAPLKDRLLREGETLRQPRRRLRARLYRRPHLWCRRRSLVKMDCQGLSPSRLAVNQRPTLFSDPPHSLRTDRAMKTADRREDM
jgi:hypothetical protein